MDEDEKSRLNILTLNTWGLLYISKDIEQRMSAIADELAKGKYHLVHLQEVWSSHHYEVLREKVKLVLPYAHYFHSGLIGSGCATFSRYPIIDTFFHKYSHNGYFWDVLHGDWFGGKGIGCAIIQHPKSRIYSFNTHLHADYVGGLSEGLAECRMLQIYQLIQFLRQSTRPGDSIILTGDLNHSPETFGVKALCELAKLKDTYVNSRTKPNECYTLNHHTNKYVASGETISRIDYIFTSGDFECTSCNLAMQQIPGTDVPYSDHEGYTATVVLKDSPKPVALHYGQDLSSVDMLHRLHDIIKKGEEVSDMIHWKKVMFFLLAFLLLVLLPIFSLDTFHVMFPPVNTLCGKCVFMIQMLCAIICLVYFWILTYIRRADVKVFKGVCAEINVRIRASEAEGTVL